VAAQMQATQFVSILRSELCQWVMGQQLWEGPNSVEILGMKD